MFRIDINKLNGKIVEKGTTKEAIADKIGVDRSTFYRRLKTSKLLIRDIHIMCDILGLSDEEALAIFLVRQSQ